MKSIVSSFVIVLIAVTVVGCAHPRIKIELPPKGADLPERIEAYKKYRPVTKTTVTSSDAATQIWLTLGNGESLYNIDDMLPAVGPRSDTAEHVRSSHVYDVPLVITTYAGIGGLIGGFAIGLAISKEDEFDGLGKPVPLTMMLVGTASLVASFIFDVMTTRHTRKAFDSYHADLMDRLELEPMERLIDAAEEAEDLNVSDGAQ